ncbi:hypothetical protein [Neobacillus niacini]|uniref:hypothetical protein n=1 Tax=Neobacillus niacini TaxID=86668 RepID=UPI0021CB151E|nr:hypothetical protein [Neobacillus niacini]MCM3763611.1 hypothetical protein [Neobacillus niacini]
MNSFMCKIKNEWHYFRMRYHEQLLESCLDQHLKGKITKKISYHKTRCYAGAAHKLAED